MHILTVAHLDAFGVLHFVAPLGFCGVKFHLNYEDMFLSFINTLNDGSRVVMSECVYEVQANCRNLM